MMMVVVVEVWVKSRFCVKASFALTSYRSLLFLSEGMGGFWIYTVLGVAIALYAHVGFLSLSYREGKVGR